MVTIHGVCLMIIILMSVLLGVMGGIGIVIVHYKRKYVGTLRIDTSDPSDGPYFFLEIESGKANTIGTEKSILLKVSTESYISQK